MNWVGVGEKGGRDNWSPTWVAILITLWPNQHLKSGELIDGTTQLEEGRVGDIKGERRAGGDRGDVGAEGGKWAPITWKWVLCAVWTACTILMARRVSRMIGMILPSILIPMCLELNQLYYTWCAGTPKVCPVGVTCESLSPLALLGAGPYEVIFFLSITLCKSLVNKWICRKM